MVCKALAMYLGGREVQCMINYERDNGPYVARSGCKKGLGHAGRLPVTDGNIEMNFQAKR